MWQRRKKHSVAFSDSAKLVKNAAGMNLVVHVVCCTYIWHTFYYYALSNSVPARVQNDSWASIMFRSGKPLSKCLRSPFLKATRQAGRCCTASCRPSRTNHDSVQPNCVQWFRSRYPRTGVAGHTLDPTAAR